MTTLMTLANKPVDVAVSMVPPNERRRTPVTKYTARIKLRDNQGVQPGKPDRIYITDELTANSLYDFVLDFNKIDLGELTDITPITIPPGLFTNEEELAVLLNRRLGTRLGKLDIIYDPIFEEVGEKFLVEIDNRSLIYKGKFWVEIVDENNSIFEGIEQPELHGFDGAQLELG